MNMFKDSIAAFGTFTRAHALQVIILAIAALIIALLSFQAGLLVGYHKAAFGNRLGDRYHMVFGERAAPDEGFGFFAADFPAAHGAVGKIAGITLPTFVVEAPDNTEKVVRIGTSTVIRRFRDPLTANDLTQGDMVVVIGEPDAQSEIQASLIRVLPPPPQQ